MVVAKRIVEKIIEDLNDRSGVGIDSLDDDIQEEIKDSWIKIVEKELSNV